MHSSLSLLSTLFFLFTSSTANPVAANPANPGLSLDLPHPFSATNSQTSNSLANVSLSRNSSEEYGINCMGSAFGCLGAAGANIMHVLRDYMTLLTKYPQISYVAGQKIACKEHSIFPFVVHGYFCAFLEGQNVPTAGVHGDLLLLKMQQLIEHGCKGCGSVPLEDGNDPTAMGKLTVNFVRSSECVGLCFYGSGGYIQEISFSDDTDAAGAANADSGAGESGNATTAAATATTSITSARYIPLVTYGGGHLDFARFSHGHKRRGAAAPSTSASASRSSSAITTQATTNGTASTQTITTMTVESGSVSIVSVRYIDPVTYRNGDPGPDLFVNAGNGEGPPEVLVEDE